MSDTLLLSLDEILELHSESLAAFGGSDGIRDISLIESAIAMPRQMFGGQYLHPDLASMAATYLFHPASNHASVDGNKRIGLRAASVFLGLNGVAVDFPVDETEQLVLAVARGEVSKDHVASFIAKLIG